MIETTARLHGRRVVDSDGASLGRVAHAYRSTDGGRPTWFTVREGRTHRFVPATLAVVEPGGPVRVATSAAHVRGAPETRTAPELDAATEAALYAHYGLLEDTPTPPAAPATYGTGHVSTGGRQPAATLATGRATPPPPGGVAAP